MSDSAVLHGSKADATIVHKASKPSGDAQDGSPAVIEVSGTVFEHLGLQTMPIKEAMDAAQADDIVIASKGNGSPSGQGAVLPAKDLASVLGLNEVDLPESFFRDTWHPDAEKRPSCCKKEFKEEHKPFHVHFGLGRLSVGLVLPALGTAGTHFGVLQRPSKTWMPLKEKAIEKAAGKVPTMEVRVNAKAAVPPLSMADNVDDLTKLLDGDEQVNIVVISDEEDLVGAMLKRATSFSCSLGVELDKALAPLIQHLEDKPEHERPLLFACENNFEPVHRLQDKFSSKVSFIDCMVDRVCVSRDVNADECAVDVGTEDFKGRMVVLAPLKDERLVPFGGDVRIPPDAKAAHFLYEFKFQLVNGAHGVLSFMTLREGGVHADTPDEKKDLPLMQPDKMGKALRAELDHWQGMRCIYLMDKYGISLIASALDLEDKDTKVFQAFLDMINENNRRLSSISDTTWRVLEGRPAYMWAQRLQPIWEFTLTHTGIPKGESGKSACTSDQCARTEGLIDKFFEFAGLSEERARAYVIDLSKYAIQLCGCEVPLCSKGGLKAQLLGMTGFTCSGGSDDKSGTKSEKSASDAPQQQQQQQQQPAPIK